MYETDFTQKQKTIKGFLFGIAAVLAYFGFTTPVHEMGHLIFATIFAGGGKITSFHSTTIYAYGGFENFMATMGGVWFESVVWILLWRACWKSPIRGVFAAVAIFGVFNNLLPGQWNYGMSGPDAQYVTGFWIWAMLWWGAWFYIIFRKIIQEKLDKKRRKIYNHDEWQADVRRRAAETRKNLSR